MVYDLNRYRQAILHSGGRLTDEPKVIRFFNRQAAKWLVSPTTSRLVNLPILPRRFVRETRRVDLGGGFSGKKLALLSEVSIHVHAAQKVSDLPLRK